MYSKEGCDDEVRRAAMVVTRASAASHFSADCRCFAGEVERIVFSNDNLLFYYLEVYLHSNAFL